MKRWIEIAVNILFWCASAWLITSSFSIQSQEIELINGTETIHTIYNGVLIEQLLICVGIAIIMFYGNLWNLVRLQHYKKKPFILLISLIILTVSAGLFYLLMFLAIPVTNPHLPQSLSFGIFLFYFTISTSYGIGKVWLKSEQKNQQLLLVKKQAELNLLRNQLQPHFLFNALNNLLSMVDQQRSPHLAGAIERLSQLLRYVIDETNRKQVPIKKEIQFLRNYGELQLMRFEENEVLFNLTVNGQHDQQPIEPGLFIPFVENAFKYGTKPETKAVIEVTFDLVPKHEIHFSIQNKIFFTREKDGNTGTGISTTKERLNIIYPGKHQLDIRTNGYFNVDLKVKTL